MPTHYQGTTTERTALDLYIKLSRSADALSTRINNHLKEVKLTISQFGVLEALYHLGSLNQSQLAEKILKSGGNMTMVIDNLVKRDLVCRERDETDRRFVTIHLTETGRELIKGIFPRHVQIVVQEVSILTHEEQIQLAALCRKIGLNQDVNSFVTKIFTKYFDIKSFDVELNKRRKTMEAVQGLHHITAFASNPQNNVDFYHNILGQRLVKTTVNFDDPGTYHLYYGDKVGTPRLDYDFFPLAYGRPWGKG